MNLSVHPYHPTHFFSIPIDIGEPLRLSSVLALSSCIAMTNQATKKRFFHTDNNNNNSASTSSSSSSSSSSSTTSATVAATASANNNTDQDDDFSFKSSSSSSSSSSSNTDNSSTNNNQYSSSSSSSDSTELQINSFTSGSMKFVNVDIGPYTLVAHGNADESDSFLSLYIYDISALLIFYLGPYSTHPLSPYYTDLSIIRGLSDLIDSILIRSTIDLSILVHGSKWLYLDEDTRDQCDRLLSTLEEHIDILASSIYIGESILHSRMPHYVSRLILHYIYTRPNIQTKLKILPVYTEYDHTWKYLILIKMRSLTLAVLTTLKCNLTMITGILLDYEETIGESGIQLPIEESPVLLRHYTGHDTLAFLYTHTATGVTVAPAPRPGPKSEQQKVIAAFHWFFSRCIQIIARSTVNECILQLKGYRFYAHVDDEYQIYALFTDAVSLGQVASYAAEILENVMRHNGALLADPKGD